MDGILQARAAHADAVRGVLNRLTTMRRNALVPAHAIAGRERELLRHLYASGPDRFDPMVGRDDAFLHWCAAWLDERGGEQSPRQVMDAWLSDGATDAACLQGALDALAWMGSVDWDSLGASLVEDHPERAAIIWRSWSDRGVDVPADVLTAGLADEDAATRAAALDHLVRSRHSPVRGNPIPDWGHDPAIDRALARHAIADGSLDVAAAPAHLDPVDFSTLELRAAAGDADVVSVLAHRVDDDPDRVLPLAGLTGSRAGAELLLDSLANPRFQFGAMAGWYLLTGQRLRLAPVMHAVGSRRADRGAARQGRSPDVSVARQWWSEHREIVDGAAAGVLLGQPFDATVARNALADHAGDHVMLVADAALLRLGLPTAGVSAVQPCFVRHRVAHAAA